MLQEELTNVQEELSKLVTEKGQLKNELANLKGSLLGNDELEDLLHESSASPEESPIRQRCGLGYLLLVTISEQTDR